MTRYPKLLFLMVVVIWVLSTLQVANLANWLLETSLDVVFVTTLVLTRKRFAFSNFSYSLMTLYLLVHFVGAFYTYSSVPFGYQLGHWLGTARNMYDRLVHFAFGFLFYYPLRELLMRTSGVTKFWSYYLPLDVIMALSALYEIGEWLTAVYTPAHLGTTFLATQGDVWDTQKDMLMAGVGACVGMAATWVYARLPERAPEPARQVRDSLRP